MKKLSLILLALLMCLSLFACTQNPPSDNETDTEPSSEQTSAQTESPTQTETEPETDAPTTSEQTTQEIPEPEPLDPVALYQLAPEKNSLMQSYGYKTSCAV